MAILQGLIRLATGGTYSSYAAWKAAVGESFATDYANALIFSEKENSLYVNDVKYGLSDADVASVRAFAATAAATAKAESIAHTDTFILDLATTFNNIIGNASVTYYTAEDEEVQNGTKVVGQIKSTEPFSDSNTVANAIAANATGIAANVLAIAANATAISVNTTNIAANATAIATNATAIAANATAIAANAELISSAQDDIDLLNATAGVTGSVAYSVEAAKSELLGTASATDFASKGNTLGKLYDLVTTLSGSDLVEVQTAIANIKTELSTGSGADLANTLIDKFLTLYGSPENGEYSVGGTASTTINDIITNLEAQIAAVENSDVDSITVTGLASAALLTSATGDVTINITDQTIVVAENSINSSAAEGATVTLATALSSLNAAISTAASTANSAIQSLTSTDASVTITGDGTTKDLSVTGDTVKVVPTSGAQQVSLNSALQTISGNIATNVSAIAANATAIATNASAISDIQNQITWTIV